MNRKTLSLALVAAILLTAALFLPVSGAEPQVQKRAFLVGVAKYKKDGLPNLNYSEDDMRELGEELAKHGFQVTTVLGPEATQANVNAALDKFVKGLGDLEKSDVALIAFSGHGVQRQTQRDGRNDEDAFFCPVDALKDNPETMVSIGLLMDQLQLKSGSSQNLILVDACRNNPAKGAKGIDGSTARNLGNKISVLFSSTNGQQSFESTKAKHGVFTHFLLEGLRGGAATRRGEVTWLTLASYVMDEVPARAPELLDDANAEQRPNLIGNLVRQPVLARIEVKLPGRGDVSPLPRAEEAEITNSIGMTLRLIPAGEFEMGSPEGESEEIDEKRHAVRITRPFYLGAHEVTLGQFRQFVEDESYRTDAEKDGGGQGWNEKQGKLEGPKPEYTWRNAGFPQTDSHPVVNVSWNDATAFLKWLSKKEGAEYRLPTEAEWEFACRAGTTTKYHSGEDPESLAKVGNIADQTAKSKLINYPIWSYSSALDGHVFTAPVGNYRANKFGLFDMHGNVREWCQDFYGANYYSESPRDNPLGPSSGDHHVLRGGGWIFWPYFVRSASRSKSAPDYRNPNTGFRVVRTP